MTVSELNAQEEERKKKAVSGKMQEKKEAFDSAQTAGNKVTPYIGTYDTPESNRLQYEYELERSREISSSVTRMMIMTPLMIMAVCILFGTMKMSGWIYTLLGMIDVITLLCVLVVTCTVHFYILNPAPSQTGEKEWLDKMKRDLQRGNNWRAWLVFSATILFYVAVALTLTIIILCLIGI